MNELKIKIDQKELVYSLPACFDKMSREQFLNTCNYILGLTDRDTYCLSMIGLDKEIWDELEEFHKYFIRQMFDFTGTETPEISKQLLAYIEIGDERYIGYQPNFSNTSWEEFIYADQYMMTGKYKEAAAVLYRQQRVDYNGETDRRSPFTIYGADSRMRHFKEIDDAQLLAFVINYNALRRKNIEEKYPFIFFSQKQKTTTPETAASFSWIGIHRDLMGDQFYDETKFFSSNVHVILSRLNRVIRENGKRKK